MADSGSSVSSVEELTDLVLDIVSHTGHFVEESERLVHALLNNAQVGQHLLHISNGMVFFFMFSRGKKHSIERTGSTKSTCFTLKTIKKSNHFTACVWCYLRSNLGGLLGIHHADVLEVFEGVLPVLLLSPHVLLQQAENMTGLQETAETRQLVKSRGSRMKSVTSSLAF